MLKANFFPWASEIIAENCQKIFACIMSPLLVTFQGDRALPCRIPSTSLKWVWSSSDLRPGAPTSQQHISCGHSNLLTDAHTHRAMCPSMLYLCQPYPTAGVPVHPYPLSKSPFAFLLSFLAIL